MYVYLQYIYSIFIPAQKWPFLAKKTIILAKLLPSPQNAFAAPYPGLCVGIYMAKKPGPREGTSGRLFS